MIDVKKIKLQDYFNYLQDTEVLQVVFLKGYFQIYFDKGIISCLSETFIKSPSGEFQVPSKEGNWELFKILNQNIVSAEEQDSEVILKTDVGVEISVNIRMGLPGDMFHIRVEDLPTLHF